MTNFLKLVAFLLRSRRQADGGGWSQVITVVVAGAVSGLTSAGLLALINSKLNGSGLAVSTLAWSFAALCALLPVSRFVSQVVLARVVQGTVFDLRMRLSRRILETPLRRLEEIGPSRLLATLSDDVVNLSAVLGNIPVFCIHVSVVFGCLAYLGWLSWKLLLLTLVFVVVGLASYQIPVARALRHFAKVREDWDNLFKHLRGLSEGTKELKLHRERRKAFLRESLEATSESLRQHNVTGATIYGVANSWGQVLFFLLIGILLFVVPGAATLSEEAVGGFALAILFMMTPLDVIMNMLPGLGRAMVAVRKIEELGLSLEEQAGDLVDREEAAEPWSKLELIGVTHTYHREHEDSSFTLGPIDLVLSRGELVFLVGGNGSGKTTLAKLLSGLYMPEGGHVTLDGRPITAESRDRYRQLFSAVFTDFYLFESFLGLGAPDLDTDAGRYLCRLQLEHKVKVQDGVLSTLQLSQGQRKRLALLTAYLEDRPIYLFDEWAADQDPHFKQIFYLQLLPELKQRGKTIVVISHDDRYYYLADRVIRLEYGQIEYDRAVPEMAEVAMENIRVAGAAAGRMELT